MRRNGHREKRPINASVKAPVKFNSKDPRMEKNLRHQLFSSLPPCVGHLELLCGIFEGFLREGEFRPLGVGVELGDLAAEAVLVAVHEVDVWSLFVLMKKVKVCGLK